MKKWIKHNYKAVIAVFLFVFIGPLIINILFKHTAPFGWIVAEWDASAALAYYGTIVAAVIAVFGVFWTIKYSQQNYREDVRNRTLPFVTLNMLKTKSRYQLFETREKTANIDNSEGYQEYKLQDYYCILEKNEILYKTGLTDEQKKLLDNGGTKWVTRDNGASLIVVDNICVPLEIENVGNGTAIRLRYGLNRKGIPEYEKRYLPIISLRTDEPILLHIFSEDCSSQSENLGEYVLSFYYQDIYSNRYRQEFPITVEYDDDRHAPVVSVDMNGTQDFLGGM